MKKCIGFGKRILIVLLCVQILLISSEAPIAQAAKLQTQIPGERTAMSAMIPVELRRSMESLGYDATRFLDTTWEPVNVSGDMPNQEVRFEPYNPYRLQALNEEVIPVTEPDFSDAAEAVKEVQDYAVNLYSTNDIVSGGLDYGLQQLRDNIIEDLSKVNTGQSGIINRIIPASYAAQHSANMAQARTVMAELARREEILRNGNLTGKTLRNFTRNTAKLRTENASLITRARVGAGVAKGVNLVFRGVGAGLSVVGSAKDAIDLATGNLYNQKPDLRATETVLLAADCGLGLATAGFLIAGVACPPALVVASLAVGIGTLIVHSHTFADAANNADSFGQFLENLAAAFGLFRKTPDGAGCYKPNIYIYNSLDQGSDIEVRMAYSQLITCSIPEYREGWAIRPVSDQSRFSAEDGQEYDYLFYESMTSKRLFQTEAGFEIDHENREGQFREILSEYGFNQREIEDFTEFWNVKLDTDTDYIMYPQLTDTVDRAMPVDIYPVPENIVRIWFAFEKRDGQEYEKARIRPFTHNGYSVIEWGGMVF